MKNEQIGRKLRTEKMELKVKIEGGGGKEGDIAKKKRNNVISTL